MKRHKALYSLSHEHHNGLMLAQLVKANSPEYKGLPKTIEDKKHYAVKFFEENLIPHFKKEEDIFFPSARGKSEKIEKLVEELIQQPNKIDSLIEIIKSSAQPEVELDELGKLLESHIRKEERELFQLVQKVFSADELEKLDRDLGSSTNTCLI